MANICIEYLWIFIFSLIKYFLDNPIFIIITLLITIVIAKKLGPMIIGILLAVIDFLKDSVDLGTFGLSIPLTIIISIGIGFGWAAMAFSSRAPGLIALLNSIPMFLFGTILGIAQIPFLAFISAITGFALDRSATINYLIGILSIAMLYFVLSFSFTIISGFCQGLDYAISLL